jgi:hypothetical protein
MELFEQKPQAQWTDHDGRTFGGLNSAFRLLSREFRQLARKQPQEHPGAALDAHLAMLRERREEGAA